MDTMTVKECVDKWIEMPDAQRYAFGSALFKRVTPVTISSLQEFQQNWDTSRPFTEFLEAQKQELEQYVKLEIESQIGHNVRSVSGLSPLTWDDILVPEEMHEHHMEVSGKVGPV